MKLILSLLGFLLWAQLCGSIMEWWDMDRLGINSRKYLIQIESQMIQDLEQKVLTLHDIRFMYEESPHYEIGYLTGEVLERYRKMVDSVVYVNTHASQLFMVLRYLMQQQHYYQEVYHIIMMLHEIPRKYGHIDEFKVLATAMETGNSSFLHETFEEQAERWDLIAKEKKRLDRERKKRLKQLKRAEVADDIMKNMMNFDPDHPNDENRPPRRPPGWTPKKKMLHPNVYGWDPHRVEYEYSAY